MGASTHTKSAMWVYSAVIYCEVNLPWASIYMCSHLGGYLLLMEVTCSQPPLTVHHSHAAARGSWRLRPQLPVAMGPFLKARPAYSPWPLAFRAWNRLQGPGTALCVCITRACVHHALGTPVMSHAPGFCSPPHLLPW